MIEFKGTKGKWKVSPIITYKVLGLGMETICELPTYENKNLEANAQLISKAPEMLEMLKRLLHEYQTNMDLTGNDIQYEIEQLIKQATTI